VCVCAITPPPEYELTAEERAAQGREKVGVAVRSRHLLATAFHPELTDDVRWCEARGARQRPNRGVWARPTVGMLCGSEFLSAWSCYQRFWCAILQGYGYVYVEVSDFCAAPSAVTVIRMRGIGHGGPGVAGTDFLWRW
jgi:hypothetical protein